MTPAETNLWNELSTNKLDVDFRRQQVIAGFVIDLYCHTINLVIEVDGGIHKKQEQNDLELEKALKEMGLMIVRFRNEEVIKDLAKVISKIRESL